MLNHLVTEKCEFRGHPHLTRDAPPLSSCTTFSHAGSLWTMDFGVRELEVLHSCNILGSLFLAGVGECCHWLGVPPRTLGLLLGLLPESKVFFLLFLHTVREADTLFSFCPYVSSLVDSKDPIVQMLMGKENTKFNCISTYVMCLFTFYNTRAYCFEQRIYEWTTTQAHQILL